LENKTSDLIAYFLSNISGKNYHNLFTRTSKL